MAGQPRGFSGGLGLAMPVFCNESSSIHGFLLPCWREGRGGWGRLPVLGESQPAAEGQPRPSALRGGSPSGLTQGTRRSESAAARCTRPPWSCHDRPGVTHTFLALFPPSGWQGTRSSSSDERSRCLVRRCPAGARTVTTGCTVAKSRARLDPEGSSSKSLVRRAGARWGAVGLTGTGRATAPRGTRDRAEAGTGRGRPRGCRPRVPTRLPSLWLPRLTGISRRVRSAEGPGGC